MSGTGLTPSSPVLSTPPDMSTPEHTIQSGKRVFRNQRMSISLNTGTRKRKAPESHSDPGAEASKKQTLT